MLEGWESKRAPDASSGEEGVRGLKKGRHRATSYKRRNAIAALAQRDHISRAILEPDKLNSHDRWIRG